MIPAPLGASIVTHTHVFALFALTTTLALAGCRGDDPGTTATDSDGSSGTAGSTTGDLPTTGGTTAEPTTGEPTTTSPVSGSTTMDCGFLGDCTTSGTTAAPGGGANGDQCATDDDCDSMNCYTNPLMPGQGVCSDYNEDADCTDPGFPSCSISVMMGWAVCEDGSLGDQCMSQAACQEGLFCEPVINIPIPGVIPDTCGECSESSDCMEGKICSPDVSIETQSGQKTCVEPGSVPNDDFCPHDTPDGDMACMSGHCGEVMFMGIVTLGICGECESDDDCMGGTCMPGEASMSGLSGSTCV